MCVCVWSWIGNINGEGREREREKEREGGERKRGRKGTCTVVSEEAENIYTPCGDSVTLKLVTIPICPLRVQ